jgi:hypothetical protein
VDGRKLGSLIDNADRFSAALAAASPDGRKARPASRTETAASWMSVKALRPCSPEAEPRKLCAPFPRPSPRASAG